MVISFAQHPVEVFGGQRKTTYDALWFKYVKNAASKNTRWLWFQRVRYAADYAQTTQTALPSLGVTTALSYNAPRAQGWAPVAVVQVFNTGVFPKLGIQWVHTQPKFTAFGWIVAETLRQPNTDVFLLLRYTPFIQGSWQAFLQSEQLYTLPSSTDKVRNFTWRARLGCQKEAWQAGLGVDTSWPQGQWAQYNPGLFIRYDFK